MIDDLITCGLRHLLRPIGNITKVQFDHVPACLTDDMMVVVFYFTELIFNTRPISDFKGHAQGFEEIKSPIDRSQSNFPVLFEKTLVEFLGT